MSYSIVPSYTVGTHTADRGSGWTAPVNGGMSLAGRMMMATATAVAAAISTIAPQVQAYQAPQPSSTTEGQHTPVKYASSTTSWDNPAESLLYRVMTNPTVSKFKRLVPAADVGAVQGIFDLAIKHFAGSCRLDTRFDLEEDESGPALFLSLDTHGMDMDEQLNHEVAMREAIRQDARLREAKQLVVINIY